MNGVTFGFPSIPAVSIEISAESVESASILDFLLILQSNCNISYYLSVQSKVVVVAAYLHDCGCCYKQIFALSDGKCFVT